MAASLFAFTPAELVALETILEERPEVVEALSERLALVSDDLARTCQGWVVTELEAEELLNRLRGEFVGRIMGRDGAVGGGRRPPPTGDGACGPAPPGRGARRVRPEGRRPETQLNAFGCHPCD